MRDGRPQSLDIAELSDDEVLSVMKDYDVARLLSWVLSLKNFIKELRPIAQGIELPLEDQVDALLPDLNPQARRDLLEVLRKRRE